MASGFRDSLRRASVMGSSGTGSLGSEGWAANVVVPDGGAGAAVFQRGGRVVERVDIGYEGPRDKQNRNERDNNIDIIGAEFIDGVMIRSSWDTQGQTIT